MKLALLGLLVVLAGCEHDVPVAEVAHGIPPMSELRGIRLGMRADELVRARPAARVASYFGYTEDLGRSDIAYEVPGSVNDGQAPPDGAHLESVTLSDSVADVPDPLLQWEAKVRAVTSVTGTAPTCYQLHWPTTTAWMATWSRGGGELFVLGQPAVKDPSGNLTPPALRVGVVRPGKAIAQAYTPVTKVDCQRIADVDSSTPRSTSQ